VEARYAPRILGYVALTGGPLAGFAAMAIMWSAVQSDLSGGLDFGVLLLGASLSAGITFGYCRYRQVDGRTSARWSVSSFAFTFAVSLIAVLVFAVWLDSLGGFGPDN
jgi:hypothetical protein